MKVPPLIINLKNIKKKKNKKHKHKHKHHSKKHHHNDFIENPPLLEPVELEGVDPTVSFLRTHDEDQHMVPITISAPLPPPPPLPASIVAPTPAPTPSPAPTTPVAKLEVSNGQVLDKDKEKTSGQGAPDEQVKANDAAAEIHEEEAAEEVLQAKPEPVVIQNKTTGAKISFLRMAEDGSVTMAIIGPTVGKSDDSNERVLNLEQICGQLSDGTDVIPSNIDEEECRDALQVKPVDFVEASAFGTYLPVEDSTFANLTKDDTETLLEIYGGNPTCYEYAKSLQDYAKGTNYLMTMVDSLLDLLTEGKHRKEVVPIREKLLDQREEEQKERLEEKQLESATLAEESKELVAEEKMEVDQAEEPSDNTTNSTATSYAKPTTTVTTTTNENSDDATTTNIADVTTSNSKADDIAAATTNNDVATTNNDAAIAAITTTDSPTTETTTTATLETTQIPASEADDNPEEIQEQLDFIENLLNELKDVQERRLSSSAAPVEPDEEETRLAEEVLSKMTKLIKEKAKPGEICTSDSIFKALGIPPLTHG